MQLELIIAALKARCPSFGGRFAGAAEYKPIAESAALAMPCGFVIPLDDNPDEVMSQNDVYQQLKDSFAVIIYVGNEKNERGQDAAHSIDAIRAELWKALLGWRPVPVGIDTSQSRYNGIVYEGGNILSIDRARLSYQFEFGAVMEIGPDDGWQETELDALQHFDGVTIRLDAIDPVDPNKANPVLDGRVEAGIIIPKAGILD